MSRQQIFEVIGIGNDFRGDDAAGLIAVDLVRRELAGSDLEALVCCRENRGDPAGLIADWTERQGVIIIDAARSSDPNGTIKRHEPLLIPLNETATGRNLHNFSLTQTIDLALSLDLSLSELTVYSIAGSMFMAGDELSHEVLESSHKVARLAVDQLKQWAQLDN